MEKPALDLAFLRHGCLRAGSTIPRALVTKADPGPHLNQSLKLVLRPVLKTPAPHSLPRAQGAIGSMRTPRSPRRPLEGAPEEALGSHRATFNLPLPWPLPTAPRGSCGDQSSLFCSLASWHTWNCI